MYVLTGAGKSSRRPAESYSKLRQASDKSSVFLAVGDSPSKCLHGMRTCGIIHLHLGLDISWLPRLQVYDALMTVSMLKHQTEPCIAQLCCYGILSTLQRAPVGMRHLAAAHWIMTSWQRADLRLSWPASICFAHCGVML